MKNKKLVYIASIAVVLAFVVVVLGAYTRLTDAGLGCPDWPGCYGHMVLPKSTDALAQAQTSYPHLPIEARKAWTEMVHRYAAGTLGLLILILASVAVKRRYQNGNTPILLPLFLLGLVCFQAALGMWTVTLKLLPTVVMGHLLGGMSILACLWWLRLSLISPASTEAPPEHGLQKLKPWIVIGIVITFTQIALGGWVSSNYAGIACIGFPYCNGQLLPHLNFSQAFDFTSPIGMNYQGGVLDSSARITIQMVHRFGALITASYLLALTIAIFFRSKSKSSKSIAGLLAILLMVQFCLGVLNVVKLLPLSVAVSHNAVAALLFLTLLTLGFKAFNPKLLRG